METVRLPNGGSRKQEAGGNWWIPVSKEATSKVPITDRHGGAVRRFQAAKPNGTFRNASSMFDSERRGGRFNQPRRLS